MAATTKSAPPDSITRLLGGSAALLFALALLTGLYAGAAMGGKIPVNGGAALAAHLNALMGTFLMVSFGWTLPMLRYGAEAKRRIALVLIVTSYANWIITAIKAALNVSGIDLVGKAANDGVFVALQIGVVIPTLIAAVAWVLGFRGSTAPRPGGNVADE